MHIRIALNPKVESDRITAFFHQLSCYDHEVVIVYEAADLMDKDQPASIDNLPIRRHHLDFVDRVVFRDGDIDTELYTRPVNRDGLWRKNK